MSSFYAVVTIEPLSSSGTTVEVTRPFFEEGTAHLPTDILDFADTNYIQSLIDSGVARIYVPPSTFLTSLLRPKEKTNVVPNTYGCQRQNPSSDSIYNPYTDASNG